MPASTGSSEFIREAQGSASKLTLCFRRNLGIAIVPKYIELQHSFPLFSSLSLQVRLAIYLKSLYIDLSLKELVLPQWAQAVAPGVLCSDSLEVELRFSSSSHGLNECLTVDQILSAVQVSCCCPWGNCVCDPQYNCFNLSPLTHDRPKKEHLSKHHVECWWNAQHGSRRVH